MSVRLYLDVGRRMINNIDLFPSPFIHSTYFSVGGGRSEDLCPYHSTAVRPVPHAACAAPCPAAPRRTAQRRAAPRYAAPHSAAQRTLMGCNLADPTFSEHYCIQPFRLSTVRVWLHHGSRSAGLGPVTSAPANMEPRADQSSRRATAGWRYLGVERSVGSSSASGHGWRTNPRGTGNQRRI